MSSAFSESSKKFPGRFCNCVAVVSAKSSLCDIATLEGEEDEAEEEEDNTAINSVGVVACEKLRILNTD